MKRILLLVIIISFSGTTLLAQSDKDSLNTELKASQGNIVYKLYEETERIFNNNGYKDNKKVRHLLKEEVFIENVKTGKVHDIHSLKNTTILFVTYWEASSATCIGYFKKRMDKGEQVDFALVYFENEKEEILEMESDSWFFDFCYVLHGKSKSIKESIARIPLILQPGNKRK